jgi:predicted DsbA family dithiol-disulfide isomerase
MKKEAENMSNESEEVDRIEIEYFTDPLCCWSWAFEPHWRKFINDNSDRINWRYRMAGMIPDWNNYSDPMNDISRPAQMAPLWLQVKYTTHTPLEPDIWLFDPPQSSLPACLAVKSAELQSLAAADLLLYTLRRAVMTQKINIARKEVILDLAKGLENSSPILDYNRFEKDFADKKASALLKEDIQRIKLSNIGRFPTLTMKKPGEAKGIILVGFRPYMALCDTFKQLFNVPEHQK